MAISKIVNGASLSIEVQKGTDKAVVPTYTKKIFANTRIA